MWMHIQDRDKASLLHDPFDAALAAILYGRPGNDKKDYNLWIVFIKFKNLSQEIR